jgi:hypothetical protein
MRERRQEIAMCSDNVNGARVVQMCDRRLTFEDEESQDSVGQRGVHSARVDDHLHITVSIGDGQHANTQMCSSMSGGPASTRRIHPRMRSICVRPSSL